jgi:putative heme-binding domain-containing protein
LAFRLGDPKALNEISNNAASTTLPPSDRIFAIELLGQLSDAKHLPTFLKALEPNTPDNVRLAAINAMQSSADDAVALKLLDLYPTLSGSLKSKSLALLSQRPSFSLLLMQRVDSGKILKTDISIDLARAMASHKEEKLIGLLTKHYGKVSPPSPGEKIARISYVNLIINRTKPDTEKGKLHFQKQCANCHMLFGQGNKVGPDLTTADRQSLIPLITHVVDPSAHIRSEFVAQVIETKDGRTLTGLLAEENSSSLTLLDAKNQRLVLAKDKIETMTSSPKSIMPENILDTLSDQDIVDLFAYIREKSPPKP